MTQNIKVTFGNLSLGYEVQRVYDSKNKALTETNRLIIQHMNKYSTHEIFVRFESYNSDVVRDDPELPF